MYASSKDSDESAHMNRQVHPEPLLLDNVISTKNLINWIICACYIQINKIMVNVLKFRTLFYFCFQIKSWFPGLHGIHKMYARIANREGPDQTASSV